jgi:hypothetical protein
MPFYMSDPWASPTAIEFNRFAVTSNKSGLPVSQEAAIMSLRISDLKISDLKPS